MLFVDKNSQLTTKPDNFGINCQSNSDSYDKHVFWGNNFMGSHNFLLRWTVFSTRYSTLMLTAWTFSYY